MKNKIFVTISAILLILLFAFLRSVWAGFVYFSISILIVISFYWIIVIILDYIYEFRTKDLEGFKMFCAELINISDITSQDIENNKQEYIKKYKKSILKYKFIEWVKILFLVSLIVISIISMIKI